MAQRVLSIIHNTIRRRQEPESGPTLSKVSSSKSLVASYPKIKLIFSTPYVVESAVS